MKQRLCLLVAFSLVNFYAFSQVDTTGGKASYAAIERMYENVKDYRLDTSAAPNDNITKKIVALRKLRGDFNINQVINSRIGEDDKTTDSSHTGSEKLLAFFQSGDGKRWLDNATIWIYRKHFTDSELTELIRFYKTSAGQKMATEFPTVMIQ